MSPVLVPPPLRPGDSIRIIAPAGPCDPVLVLRGLGWLAQHFRLKWTRELFSREGYLAGSDSRRLVELQRALNEPDTGAIVAVRGGYGCSRIVEAIDFSALHRHPKWLVGFSDITTLHLQLQSKGICSLHAAHLGELGRGAAQLRARWLEALSDPTRIRFWTKLQSVRGGTASGPLAGGNLAILHDRAAAGKLTLPAGCILFLEEVNEAPYALDRMLTALCIGGHLSAVSAIVLGELVGCEPREQALAAIIRVLTSLDIPIVAEFPAGHGPRNEPLHLGLPAVLDATEGTLTLCPESST